MIRAIRRADLRLVVAAMIKDVESIEAALKSGADLNTSVGIGST
jgi:hypothetical protein